MLVSFSNCNTVIFFKIFDKSSKFVKFLGVNTLAYGHYRITSRVVDTTPAARAGDDIVMSAAEAALLIRPGRPTALFMPDGVDPVAEVAELHADRAANFRARIAAARAQMQVHHDPYDRKLNAPLVAALMTGVVYGKQHFGFDNDFDVDEINGLFETAKAMYHEHGRARDVVFEEMLVLVGSMREMKSQPALDSDEEEEADGVMIDDDFAI